MSTCSCDACCALAAEFGSDPEMLAFLRRRLLVRGWATFKSPAEKAYVLAHSTWAKVSALKLAKARETAGLPHESPPETTISAKRSLDTGASDWGDL